MDNGEPFSNSIERNGESYINYYDQLRNNSIDFFKRIDVTNTINKKKSGLASSDPWLGLKEEDYFYFDQTEAITSSRNRRKYTSDTAYDHVVYGPMFSGKSYATLDILTTYAVAGKRVLCLHINYDTRYGLDPGIKTHNGLKMNESSHENIRVVSIGPTAMSHFVNGKIPLPIGGVDVIGIDELHFWRVPNEESKTKDDIRIQIKKEVMTFRNRCINIWKINLVVSGVNLWASGDPVVHIETMLHCARHTKQLTAICEICERPNAIRTVTRSDFKKMTEGNYTLEDVKKGPKVEMGGREGYLPVCEECYTNAIMMNIRQQGDEKAWLEEFDKRICPGLYIN